MKKFFLSIIALSFVLISYAQTIEKVEEYYYLVSPNAQYYAGSQEGASAYRYSLATKEENRIDPDGDLGFKTNAIANDGTVAGSYGWKAALWGEDDSYEYLPLPKEGLTELEKASNDAVVISADGKQIVVAMNADAPKTYYVYTKKEDGSYDMVKLPMPEKDPIYGMYAQWYGVRDMSLDGNTLIGFFLTDDSMRQLPLIWRRVDGVWSYEFFGLDVCLKEDMTIPPYPYDKVVFDEIIGDYFLPYDVWEEWTTAQYEAESGYYYQAKGMSMSGNGRYVALDMGIQLEGEMYGTIYAAAYDLEKDTVVVFQDIQNSTSLSVNDNGEVIVATPKTDSFRWSYVVSINEPSKFQTLTEWVKVRTEGAIDLANYMTYQLDEEFVVVEGTAYWAKEGDGLVTYMWDYFGTGMFESFFVAFNGSFIEDDNEGEDPDIPEVLGDTLKFGDVDYCIGAIFNKVSNNGKYVAGYASDNYGGMNVGFVYLVEEDTLICLNPEWEDNVEQSHFVKATAMDVSDAGIVVGQYAFDDMQVRPAFYNITTGAWTELERPANVVGKIKEPGSLYGEATSISADGKYIGGYVVAQMDNSTRSKQIRRNVACVWVRTNDDELNPIYELQKPIDEDHTKIMTQGDWAWHMSDDAKWLGGNSSANSGCFNIAIWENNYIDTLKRNVLIGKVDWDRSEDTNEDGIIDEEDGVDAGQYFWYGIVTCVSPSGEWIVGYHTFNGTGYNDVEISTPVGFRYNTKTEVLEDTLFAGCPTVVFDNGEMIFDQEILSSSVDKKVQCGTYVINIDGLGQRNVPLLIIDREEDNTEDDDGDDDIIEEEVYGLYVASENPEMGGVKIILVAEAIEGFEFVEWSDGNTANPRIIELIEDTELYARFRIESEITNVETSKISVAEVYSRDGVLYVEGAESDYHVLDMAGRLIYSGRQSALNLPRGVYLVTIAGEVEKVVI